MPACTPQTIGTYRPDELLGAIRLFEGKYESE